MTTNRFQEKAEVEVYATTLYDSLAGEGIDALVEARNQMEQIVAYNRSHTELLNATSESLYTPEQRANLVREVFKGVSPALQGMLGVMAQRSGLDKLPRVLESFNEQISEKMGVVVVDVVTCVPLDDHLRDVIKKKASADLGRDVVLREQVDESILGGIIMSAEGKRIDASVKSLAETARVALKKSN